MSVTYKKIAEAAGVSVSTVSKAREEPGKLVRPSRKTISAIRNL